ncbi:MAG TPA: GntR family transcriptional regulator [Kribbella sp.]
MPIDLTALIDPHAQLPKFRQLAARIREAIDDGRLAPGEELPSQAELQAATGMSVDSIRKAIALLAADGLVVSRQGSPTRVAEAPMQRRMAAARYVEELEVLRRGGDHPKTSAFTAEHGITWQDYSVDVEIAKEPATAEDARRLRVPEGTDILRRRFVKYVKGRPVQLQRSAIPWDIAGDTPVAEVGRQPWPGGTIAELYSLGLVATFVEEEIRTRAPRDEERRALRMETAAPVFDVVRVFEVDGRPVEASRVIVPGPEYVLHYGVDLT